MTKVTPFKICLVGDSGTGKTSLLSRFVKNKFNLDNDPTIAVNQESYEINVNNTSIKTLIFDIGGDEKFRALADYLYLDADGILLVYDTTDNTTFENIIGWLKNRTPLANPKTVIKLIGNKSDLEHQRTVPLEKAQTLADDYGISFTETSALNASHVIQSFQWTIQQICSATKSTYCNSDNALFSTCAFISNSMAKHFDIEKQVQEKERPFHVVLVDIHQAAQEKIACVEKPLDDPDLKYVAISYRWGELHETLIDTGVGYPARVTSFHLNTFYQLCNMIKIETDLKDIDYVWVDVICVDQINHDKRKATIHQMSNIYERASYILAVPDLHLEHLTRTSDLFRDIVLSGYCCNQYLYALIQGDATILDCIDNAFLDECNVPNDPDVRQLLKSYTNHFMPGFMECNEQRVYYDNDKILDHLYESSKSTTTTTYSNSSSSSSSTSSRSSHSENDCQCHCDLPDCPFQKDINDCEIHWKQQIYERSLSIHRSIQFMSDLIKDWSSRVWVISEYNIAKKKNNMKYWFVQLGNVDDNGFSFFKFDFEESDFSNTIQKAIQEPDYAYHQPIYLKFHETMLNQLKQQSFLEMILKSKATKNEDRFYSILPLTDYKTMITNKSKVDQWNINTLSSVKLKLYEFMNTKDKLNLLFLSSSPSVVQLGDILPTFATSSIVWDNLRMLPIEPFTFKDMDMSQCNFDLDSNDAITLCQQQKNSNLPYLNLKPKEYYIINMSTVAGFMPDTTLWHRLQSQDPNKTNTIVCIPSWNTDSIQDMVDSGNGGYPIILNGNFKNNIWILERFTTHYIFDTYWDTEATHHTLDEHSDGFHIY